MITYRYLAYPARGGRCLLAFLVAWSLGAAVPVQPLPSEAKTWLSARSAHFQLYSEESASDTQTLAEGFETLREVLRGASPDLRKAWSDALYPRAAHVFLFSRTRNMEPYAPLPNIAGFFSRKGDGDYIACSGRGADALETVYHEYTHSYMHQNFTELPLWLDEGLAVFYSTMKRFGTEVRLGLPHPRGSDYLSTHSPMSLAELLQIRQDSREYQSEPYQSAFYASAWLTVHYLLTDSKPRREQFGDFLAMLKTGTPAAEALPRALHCSLQELQQGLDAHLQRMKHLGVPYWNVTFKSLPVDPAFSLAPMGYPDLLARLGLLALNGDAMHQAFASRHFEMALARDSECAAAHFGLGLLQLQDGAEARSEASILQAMGGLPEEPEVQLLGARILIQRAIRSGQVPGSDVDEARAALIRCLRSRPGDSVAIELLCHTYEMDPAALAEGLAIMVRAQSRRPDMPVLHLGLGRLQLLAGHAEEARSQLEKAVAQTLDVQVAAKAREILQHLESSRSPLPGAPAAPIPSGTPMAKLLPALKFQLPEKYTALGLEVQKCYMRGDVRAAVHLVEVALAKSRVAWEKAYLKSLLTKLRSQQAVVPVDSE